MNNTIDHFSEIAHEERHLAKWRKIKQIGRELSTLLAIADGADTLDALALRNMLSK